jgi:molybdate transport system regulatory protein
MKTESAFVNSNLHLTSSQGGDVSVKRISLLEAIETEGSISAAAKRLGMSYRSAWDAVAEMNNMWDSPLVEKSPGGVHGGSACLTQQGRELVASFKLLQQDYQRFTQGLNRNLTDFNRLQQCLRRLSMRTSARNQFQGRVEAIRSGKINSEITLSINESDRLTAVITSESVEALGLSMGSEVYALIKASFIVLVPATENVVTSASNCLRGTVSEIRHGSVNSEAIIELDGGKTLAAVITEDCTSDPEFQEGRPVCALIKATHVILGVN